MRGGNERAMGERKPSDVGDDVGRAKLARTFGP